MDESLDIIGIKTVNTLISFYYALKCKKCVLLIDCEAIESVNARKIKQIAENAIILSYIKFFVSH
jgi:hypothetical protein